MFVLDDDGATADGLRRGARSAVAAALYASGSANGAGCAFVLGQSNVKPPGAVDEGVTR